MARIRKKDGLPFYEGEAKTKKLNELRDLAVSHHQQATNAWRGALAHAYEAGKVLNEAKRIVGHGKWTSWLDRNFCKVTGASKETARVYMRIAKRWDDPRLREARARGITQSSIQSVLKVLRGDTERKATKPSEREFLMDEARKDLRKEFAEKLRSLDYNELMLLAEGFDFYFWPNMNNDLRDTLCKVLEHDYYDPRIESDGPPRPKAGLLKATKALNERRKKKQ